MRSLHGILPAEAPKRKSEGLFLISEAAEVGVGQEAARIFVLGLRCIKPAGHTAGGPKPAPMPLALTQDFLNPDSLGKQVAAIRLATRHE